MWCWIVQNERYWNADERRVDKKSQLKFMTTMTENTKYFTYTIAGIYGKYGNSSVQVEINGINVHPHDVKVDTAWKTFFIPTNNFKKGINTIIISPGSPHIFNTKYAAYNRIMIKTVGLCKEKPPPHDCL